MTESKNKSKQDIPDTSNVDTTCPPVNNNDFHEKQVIDLTCCEDASDEPQNVVLETKKNQDSTRKTPLVKKPMPLHDKSRDAATSLTSSILHPSLCCFSTVVKQDDDLYGDQDASLMATQSNVIETNNNDDDATETSLLDMQLPDPERDVTIGPPPEPQAGMYVTEDTFFSYIPYRVIRVLNKNTVLLQLLKPVSSRFLPRFKDASVWSTKGLSTREQDLFWEPDTRLTPQPCHWDYSGYYYGYAACTRK